MLFAFEIEAKVRAFVSTMFVYVELKFHASYLLRLLSLLTIRVPILAPLLPNKPHKFPLKLARQVNPINHASINTTDAKETGNYMRPAPRPPAHPLRSPNYSLRTRAANDAMRFPKSVLGHFLEGLNLRGLSSKLVGFRAELRVHFKLDVTHSYFKEIKAAEATTKLDFP